MGRFFWDIIDAIETRWPVDIDESDATQGTLTTAGMAPANLLAEVAGTAQGEDRRHLELALRRLLSGGPSPVSSSRRRVLLSGG